MHAFEEDVVDAARNLGVDDDAVFAGAADVVEADVVELANGAAGEAGEGGDVEGFAGAPEDGGEAAGVDGDVAELDVLDGAAVAELEGEAAVGAFDNAIAETDSRRQSETSMSSQGP